VPLGLSRSSPCASIQAAAEPKELMIIKGANHVDLYDRVDLIPFEQLTRFFQKNLQARISEKLPA